MKTQHTPAPWKIHDHERNVSIGITSNDGAYICELKKDNHHFDIDEVNANARLIKEAPMMLICLEAILKLNCIYPDSISKQVLLEKIMESVRNANGVEKST